MCWGRWTGEKDDVNIALMHEKSKKIYHLNEKLNKEHFVKSL